MPQWTYYRARVAALSRDRAANDPDLLDARRNLRAARLEEYIARTVAAAPPLTEAQRSRLALLLHDAQRIGQQRSGRVTADRPPDAEQRRVNSTQQAMEGQR